MKKAGLLIILGIMILTIFASAVMVAGEYTTEQVIEQMRFKRQQQIASTSGSKSTTTAVIGTIGDALTLIEGIIAKIFMMISVAPSVWIRVMFFIAIFAVIFKILQMKTMVHILDRKTAGILGFVVAFATAALTPEVWLYLALNMYSGLIMTVILAIPLVFGALMTRNAIRAKPKALEMILLIIGWIFYLFILSTAFSALSTIGLEVGGWLGFFQTMAFLIAIVMIIICIWVAASGKGNQPVSKVTGDMGGWVSGLFGGSSGDLTDAIVEAETIEAHLNNALVQAGKSDAARYNQALFRAQAENTTFIDDYIPVIEKTVTQLSTFGLTSAEKRANQKDLKEIKTKANTITQTIITLKSMLTPTGGAGAIDWKNITDETDAIKNMAGEIKKKIEALEVEYETKKAAHAASTP